MRDIDDLILNYDPGAPHARFSLGGVPPQQMTLGLPHGVPWPAGGAPVPQPLTDPHADTDSLARFNGYDAVIVTWTAAEASALAALMTPGFTTRDWYPYRHGVADYIPLVTGPRAPFRDSQPDMARCYHTMGLYFPVLIGGAKVLLFKSGLHLAYDGPATPVRRLMAEIATTVRPKIMITTGTGGGIGADVMLGDVIVASECRFECRRQFASEPWAHAVFRTETPSSAAMALMLSASLMGVNAGRIDGARPVPHVYVKDPIVTTDFFAFDDSSDYYKLQGLGMCCDMGDAMVADALRLTPEIKFYAIRNASDPQIPNPTNSIRTAETEAGRIYAKFGGLTTAASVIACWAIIRAATA